MASNWYLIKSGAMTGGFETEDFDSYAEDGFTELLNSGIADTVELYNYDLSECSTIKALIENKMQDTKLQSTMRQIVTKIGTIKAGMYVKYRDKFWLIIGNVDNDGTSEKGVITLCNYLLTWVNSEGEIIQRWANCVSASQYNNGETGMKYYFVRSDQLLVSIPDDDECLLLNAGQRFIIDKRCKIYERNMSSDVNISTDNPLIVYELTRADTVLYDYQDSGHSEFIAYQDEQRTGDGFYRINGRGYWLGEEDAKKVFGEKEETTALTISAEEEVVYCGIEPAVFTLSLSGDSRCCGGCNSQYIEGEVQWTIVSDFTEKLYTELSNNYAMVGTDDESLIGKKFKIFATVGEYKSNEITITIKSFI